MAMATHSQGLSTHNSPSHSGSGLQGSHDLPHADRVDADAEASLPCSPATYVRVLDKNVASRCADNGEWLMCVLDCVEALVQGSTVKAKTITDRIMANSEFGVGRPRSGEVYHLLHQSRKGRVLFTSAAAIHAMFSWYWKDVRPNTTCRLGDVMPVFLTQLAHLAPEVSHLFKGSQRLKSVGWTHWSPLHSDWMAELN